MNTPNAAPSSPADNPAALGIPNEGQSPASRSAEESESFGPAAPTPETNNPVPADPVTGLLHVYIGLSQTFHRLWDDLASDYGAETAHDLRVNVKRQRAFWQSLEWLSPSFSAQDAAQVYRALYRCAGRVRDGQVEQYWLRKYERKLGLSTPLLDDLLRQEQRDTERLRRYRQRHSLIWVTQQEALVMRTIQQLDPVLVLPTLHHDLQQHLAQVVRAGQPDQVPEKHLHDLRKQLKTLAYCLDVWGSLTGTALLSDPAARMLQDLQHHLGQWHDHAVLLLHTRKVGIPEGLQKTLRVEAKTLKGLCRRQLTALSTTLTTNLDC